MKNLLIVLLLSVFGWQAQAQEISEKTVPSTVLNSFQQQFPDAKDVEWEKDNGLLKVEYEMGKLEHCAWLDVSGKVVKSGHEVEESQLPAPVKTSLAQRYGSYKVDDVLLIEQDQANYYSIELEKGREERVVLFNADGKERE